MEFSICAFFTFKNQYNQETSNVPHLKSTSSSNWRDVLKNLQDKEIILAATWATWLRNRCWFYVYFSCLGSRRCWRTDSIFYFSGHGHECLLYICCVFGWRLQEWNAQLVCILLQILIIRERIGASWFHECSLILYNKYLYYFLPLRLCSPRLFWWSDHICFRQGACLHFHKHIDLFLEATVLHC